MNRSYYPLVFCLAYAVGCGDADDPAAVASDGGAVALNDAGMGADSGLDFDATVVADAGPTDDIGFFVDAGVQDAGSTDSGASTEDAAVSPSDSGIRPRDTGVRPRDTGVRPRDAGVSPRDTGVRPRDTGVSPRDTGRPDSGAEPNVHCAAYIALRNSCAGCHGRQGGFSLGNGSPDAIRAAVLAPNNQARGMDYVNPGDPSDSYLWHKINGTQRAAGGRGGVMPPGRRLNATQLNQIEAWINAGAPAAACP